MEVSLFCRMAVNTIVLDDYVKKKKSKFKWVNAKKDPLSLHKMILKQTGGSLGESIPFIKYTSPLTFSFVLDPH